MKVLYLSLSVPFSTGNWYSGADHFAGAGSTGCSIVATGVSKGGGDYIVRISHISFNWISSGYNIVAIHILAAVVVGIEQSSLVMNFLFCRWNLLQVALF